MVDLYTPQYEDLWFREMLMSDEATMSYNHAYGGTIDFPESIWMDWYERWVQNTDGKRFYRYLRNGKQKFVGEIAYYYDGKRNITSVIIYSGYRGKDMEGKDFAYLRGGKSGELRNCMTTLQ